MLHISFVIVLPLVKNVGICKKQKRMSIKYVIFNHSKVCYEIFNNVSNTSHIVKECKLWTVDR